MDCFLGWGEFEIVRRHIRSAYGFDQENVVLVLGLKMEYSAR